MPDLLLNRVAVNAAMLALGKKSLQELDAFAHANQQDFAPPGARRDPDTFWKRTAAGTPRLRLDGRDGKTQIKLGRQLQFLQAGEDVIERVRRWPLWALIHPEPIDSQGLVDLEELISDLTLTKPWFEVTDRGVSPVDQVRRIVELVEADKVELALNAHWLSMRRASIEADLARYVHLYRGWLLLRATLEQHALFKPVVPLLYEFTAYWFGQVEILADRFLRPISDERHRFFEFVESTLATLRDPALPVARPWNAFHVGTSAEHPGLRVQPKTDLSAHYFNGEEMEGLPIAEFWKAWPMVQLVVGAKQAAVDPHPGLHPRPRGWRSRYATRGPQPIDVARKMTAAQLARALGDLKEADVLSMREAGKLFDIPHSGTASFPAFQALKGVRGEPLAKVLEALGAKEMSGVAIWNFFDAKSPMLADLSPIELLSARPGRIHAAEASAKPLLNSPPSTRLMVVLAAAKNYRKTLARAC
ncbi:hypothetical protein ACVNIS_11175 [Sphaerotilaceae bacterium SBD11-9]